MKNDVSENQRSRMVHSSHSFNKKYKNKNENKKRENLYRDIFLFSEEKEDSSEDDDNPEINITIYFDGRKILTKFNRHKPFTDLVKYLQNRYFRVGFEENYKIFYNNTEIPMNYKRKIKKIINENENDVKFILKTKEKSFINSNIKKLYIELENIPSFMDLSTQINNFINSQKNTNINFDIIYKDNSCRILFSSSEISFSFISYMMNIKFKNKYYRKLKIDIKYNALEGSNLENNKNYRYISGENIIDKEKKIKNSLANSHKNLNTNKIKSRNNNINNIKSYTESKNENKFEYEDFYEDNYESIQDSTPYGYEDQLARMQEILNKKKWMDKKNFFTSINKNSFNRMITPNKYYFRKIRNLNRNNNKNEKNDKKIGISPYNNKVYKLKISEV